MNNQLEEQFIQMLEENKNDFYKMAYSYVKTEANALDMMGEATYLALNALPTLREPQYMKTWFYRILINTCKQFLRKNKQIIYTNDLLERIPTKLAEREELMDLYEAVQELAPKYREVILLKYFKQMSIQEISTVLSRNPNTIKSHLKRGIAKLRQTMGGMYNG
ncbi:sigma-70 family RNA polymerase sigma factor [Cytobacillus spongiae]|uniref:sigma-70 family RNA polymerase sigma factor n=1 Tax=Cytobacillus spongiae TaxID=2901381 RepID=UPI001F2DEB52|nr:sigma-70 family RNA polymerase sigma factor [Cytobacillus spongiae]UII55865.1 sigma-70 family RNA polymerase sigma factor [Cytobacillus spongiae]